MQWDVHSNKCPHKRNSSTPAPPNPCQPLSEAGNPLPSAPAGTGAYTVSLPADKGVVLQGAYMLFALHAQGAPSNARVITVTDPAAG
ncbi:galactose oxidase-like domain-containing protein [Streptomyces microflavus]|uniref:galactose oxidase-like domain-containing protein n=1 Tax=Streptomyces microflavus TaxID=1919 RepID=UPI0029C0CC59|nr:galactose oxidase-like domain-containing protein [Streptomyces microflavus]